MGNSIRFSKDYLEDLSSFVIVMGLLDADGVDIVYSELFVKKSRYFGFRHGAEEKGRH